MKLRFQTLLWVLLSSTCALVTLGGAHVYAQRAGARRPPAAAPRAAATTPAANDSTSNVTLSAEARAALDAAVAALEANRIAEAERAARNAVSIAHRSPVTHNLLGVVLDRAGRSAEALNEFNQAINLDARFVSARNNLGRLLAQRGQLKEAIAEFASVLQIDPAHVQAHYNLGALYGDGGDFARSAEHFARARAAAPNDPQLALAFLNVAYRAGRKTEAAAAAELVERVAGSDARALFTLATALAQNEQYERAARLYARVNELQPRTFETLYNLGIVLYNLERNEEAARFLAEAAD
ncbi:MAG: tetratricopeptide repeat protein, partial [Pyrinomonadaceae bacterium]